MEQQLSLFNESTDDGIVKICELSRSDTPLTSTIKCDESINYLSQFFDYDFNGKNTFYPFNFPSFLDDLDWSILCIVGASGSGKSILARHFKNSSIEIAWDNLKSILSNFDNLEEGVEKLIACGLCSIPTYAKPRNVLSIGEGFRVDMARKLGNECVIDEYISNVDRNVALSTSKSIGKYIRNKRLKKCVFVSPHKDFIDCLCPDYVIDLDDECVYDTRRLLCRNFELQVYESNSKDEIWNIFKQYHYLSSDLNKSAKCFISVLNNTIVACCYVLPVLNGAIKNAYRIHRLVVLPDYQGFGIGTKLLEYVADIYKYYGCGMYIRTRNLKMAKYLYSHNDKWQTTGRNNSIGMDNKKDKLYNRASNRKAYSFKYISPCLNNKPYNKVHIKTITSLKNQGLIKLF